MNVTIDAHQLNILEDFFQQLSTADQAKIFKAGFRKAAEPLVKTAQANVKVFTGNLRRSIGTKTNIPGDIGVLIGARTYGQYKGYHGHLIESGTELRYRKKRGSAVREFAAKVFGGSYRRGTGATGAIAPRRFFEKAWNATQEQVYGEIENEWYNQIDKFIIRTNKKLAGAK